MKGKILGILVVTLLITPFTISTLGFENDQCNIVNKSNVNPEEWHNRLYVFDVTLGRQVNLVLGEATDANDGPPKDAYDVTKIIMTDFDAWFYETFGSLEKDYKKYPDIAKPWELAIYSDHNAEVTISVLDFKPHNDDHSEYDLWQIFDYQEQDYTYFYDIDGGYFTYNHLAGNTYWFRILGHVNSPPNTPDQPSGPTSLKVGERGIYASKTTDPDNDAVYYRFDWGDGVISEWSTSDVASGDTFSMDHAYSSPGTYSVKAQTKDRHYSGQGPSDWSNPLIVTVEEEQTGSPPEIPEALEGPGIYEAILYGEPYEYTTVTTDPDGDQISYQFFWYYEDEYSEWSTFLDSGEPCTMEHTWENPGYTQIMILRARAKDENDMYSDWNEPIDVWITGPPDAATIEGPTSGKPGIEHTYTLSATDPENDPVRFVVDWGDGTTDTETGEIPSGMIFDVGHTWQSEGTYTVSVQVIDAHEAWGPVTTLSVTMPRNRLINNPMFTMFIEVFIERFPLFARLLRLL